MKLPTIAMKEATERERRLLERLHEPFDNEKRLFIVRCFLEEFREDILIAVDRHIETESGNEHKDCSCAGCQIIKVIDGVN